LKCMRRLKRKNIKRFKRFKPQALRQILAFVIMMATISVILNLIQDRVLRNDSDFRQNDGYERIMLFAHSRQFAS